MNNEKTCMPNYEEMYHELNEKMHCQMKESESKHHAEIERLKAENKKILEERDSIGETLADKNIDYWELRGKVEAYELCIKAFTGFQE